MLPTHYQPSQPEDSHIMKRPLLIGFTACSFALAPISLASAMPVAHPNVLTGDNSAIIQVHGYHGGRGHHYGWGRGHHHGWHHHGW
jgi:hypothetical protein